MPDNKDDQSKKINHDFLSAINKLGDNYPKIDTIPIPNVSTIEPILKTLNNPLLYSNNDISQQNKKIESLQNSINDLQKNNEQSLENIKNEITRILKYREKDREILENTIEDIKKNNEQSLENIKNEYRQSIIKLNIARDNFIKESKDQKDNFHKLASDIIDHINTINGQVEDILKEVSTGSMGSSFLKEKQLHAKSRLRLSFLFISCILIIAAIPCALYYFNILSSIIEWKECPILIIFALIKVMAFEWPFIWLANLVSRRMQIQERICEEYSFKYSVILTYAALRNEIKLMHPELNDLSEHQELKSFTEKMANAMFINPSTFFNKKIDSYSPINELAGPFHTFLQGKSQLQDAVSQIKK